MGNQFTKILTFDGKMITGCDPLIVKATDFQRLDNFRYNPVTGQGIKPLGGMSKINTTATTKPKMRSGHHFVKDYPVSESHVLVQAFNSGLTDSDIVDNETAIPSTGEFNATAISSGLGANIGRFSDLPDGCVGFWNESNALVWGGKEARCAGFVVFDPADTFRYDNGDKVANNLTDSANVASMKSVAASVDSSTIALWHLDNALTDSSANGLTLTNVDVTFTATDAPYGTHWAAFNGTSSYLYHADNAKFYFNNDAFTIEATIRTPDTAPTRQQTIYSQSTSTTGYIVFRITGTGLLQFALFSSLETKLSLTGTTVLADNTTYKVAVVEDGDNYYLFLDGVLEASTISTERPENYTGPACIGILEAGDPIFLNFEGNIDEVRLSSVARYTTDYSPEPTAFGSVPICHAYVYSPRPIRGVKWYVATANDSTSAAQGYYWNGNSWVTVGTITDGTTSSGKTLAQTGSLSFTSTVGLAKPMVMDGVMAYVYYFKFFNLNNTTYPTVSQITVDAAMQPFTDIWDGVPREIQAFWEYTPTMGWKDYTGNIQKADIMQVNITTVEEATATNSWSYVPVTYYGFGHTTSSAFGTNSYVLVGVAQKATGLVFNMVRNRHNVNVSLMVVEYWNGSAWVEVDHLQDGTLNETGTKTLNHSGIVTWDAVSDGLEFRKAINNTDIYLYYYKISFTAALSIADPAYESPFVDQLTFIPAPLDFDSYKTQSGFRWRDRTVLLSMYNGQKDKIFIGGQGSSCTFNGADSWEGETGGNEEFTVGGELVIYGQDGIDSKGIICSKSKTYVLSGTNPSDYKILCLSDKYGCVAWNTFDVFMIRVGGSDIKNVAIWRAADGMVVCDGFTVEPMSDDIYDLFDPHSANYINTSYVKNDYGRFDGQFGEYHYFTTNLSGTSINVEKILNTRKPAWSSAVRTPQLFGIIPVTDTNGNKYSYGMTNTGYLERLEYGNDFDGNDITYDLRTGDGPWVDDESKAFVYRSTAESIRVLAVANASADKISVIHYGDTATTGATLDATISQTNSSGRVIFPNSLSVKDTKPMLTHSVRLTVTMDDISTGFEPLAIIAKCRMSDGPDTGR